MIGKIFGALAGKRIAEHTSGKNGAGGLVMGVAATSLLKRAGPLGLVAALAGSYFLKRRRDHQTASYGRPSKK